MTINVFVNNTKLYLELSWNIFILQFIYYIYDIYLFLSANLCYITYALSEQQKINSGFFLYEAEQKAKKAKKNISDIRRLQQTKLMNALSIDRTSLQLIVAMSLTSWMKNFKNRTGQSIIFLFYVWPLQHLNKII